MKDLVVDFAPRISVIIPIYNAQAFLTATLNSVCAQTYSNFEVILVDDGSTDNSLTLIQPYLEKHRDKENGCFRLVTQPNQGVSKARNNGFSHANGEYVTFLDSDDCWFPDKLAHDVETLSALADKTCLVYSGVYCVGPQNRLTSIRKFITQHDHSPLLTILINNLMIPSSTLMHRDVVSALGGFPSDTYHEDRVFFVRACKRFSTYSTHRRSVVYRESLAGRLRKILSDYDHAIQAEFSVIKSLQEDLSPEEIRILSDFQTRSIFNRFLRYNLLPSAKRYAGQLPKGALDKDLKGLISKVSLAFNINIMYWCQLIIYGVVGTLLQPWWYLKSSPLRKRNAL